MTRYCSFCGRREREVGVLVEAPDVAICNLCIAECAGAIAAFARHDKPGPIPFESWLARWLEVMVAGDDPGDAA